MLLAGPNAWGDLKQEELQLMTEMKDMHDKLNGR